LIKKQKKLNLLYLIYSHEQKRADDAFSVTTVLRKKAFEELGIKVEVFSSQCKRSSFFGEFLKTLKLIKKADIIYINIDGSSILEKYSLLKIFKPSAFLLWEIHGQVEEIFWQDRSLRMKLIVFKRNLKRKILSRLVDGSVCLDKNLETYSRESLGIKKSFVVPSFVDDEFMTEILNSQDSRKNVFRLFLNNKRCFKVLWGGGAGFRWQAIDLIEKVARKIYTIDKEIVFLVIGSNKWYRFNFFKNIISLDSYPQKEFFYLIKQSSVCLALYHTDKQKTIGVPFYFSPLKLVEYMALGKPVIATAVGQIKEVIMDENNGFLTNNSVNDIVQKILYLKKNPSFSKKIGQKAQETAFKDYSLGKAAQRYKKAFRELNLV